MDAECRTITRLHFVLRTKPSDKENVANAQQSAMKPRILQVLCQKVMFCDSNNKEHMLRCNFTETGDIVVLVCLSEEEEVFIFWEGVLYN